MQVSGYNWVHAGSRLCMKKDLGLNGNLFGGNLLSWADEFAAIYAREVTGEKYIVTYRFGEILFKHPVREGDLVRFFCQIYRKGETSVSFNIRATVNDNIVFETECTFVACDNTGRKICINWKE